MLTIPLKMVVKLTLIKSKVCNQNNYLKFNRWLKMMNEKIIIYIYKPFYYIVCLELSIVLQFAILKYSIIVSMIEKYIMMFIKYEIFFS